MSAADTIDPLGIDNVIFDVADLDAALSFYEACGFRLKFKVEAKRIALFTIGRSTPGLMLVERAGGKGRLWVEVADAYVVERAMHARGLACTMIETATGRTCEIRDSCGNIIGFADYSQRQELARPR